MLRPDVIVPKLARLFDGQFEYALGLRCERHFTERQRLGEPRESSLDLGLDGLEAQAEALQHRGGDAFAVADQAEKDVLRAHEIVAEAAGLLTCQDDDPSRSFGESFKHWSPPPLSLCSFGAFFLR